MARRRVSRSGSSSPAVAVPWRKGASLSRRAAGRVPAALLSLLLVVAVEQPALAQEGSPSAGCAGGGLTAPEQAAALGLAAECGEPVEIESARQAAQRQFAQPDGSVTLESYLRPQWARDDSGQWVDVDPTLRAEASGEISTAATVVDLEVSPGGVGALVRMGDDAGRSLHITWPEALPEPVLEGATATYPEVYDGVDLRVTAGVDSFSYALVVHSAEAATNPELTSVEVGVAGDGLETSQTPDGAVVARGADGAVVFAAPGAAMWDSSSAAQMAPEQRAALAEGNPASQLPRGGDVPGAEPGRLVEIGVELDGTALRVEPDQAMLADPQVEFPVTIDPTFAASRLAWTNVGDGKYADDTWWDDAVWPREDGLRMGYLGWIPPDELGYGTWRSIARFDTAALRGSTVNSAEVGLTVYHTGGCDTVPLELWRVLAISQGAVPTSWNSTSSDWRHGGPLDTQTLQSANSTGEWCEPNPDREVTFDGDDIRHHVQRHADVRYQSITFGLRAADESDMLQWMRAYADSFLLTANYTPVVAVPSGLATDGVGCLAPDGSRVAGSSPLLSGVPRNSEGTVEAHVQVRAVGGSEDLRSWSSGAVPSGEEVGWQVDEPLPDGEYRWRMRSENPESGTMSAWSGWCEFAVDSTLDEEPPAGSEPVECPVEVPDSGEPLEAADESIALLLAEACDAQVEAMSERDFGTRVLARPDGTLVAEQFTEPQWAHDADGEWTEVDTGFEVAGDGRIATSAAVSEIEVSGGGDDPLVTATDPDGGSVSLWWPEALPTPVVDGDIVTYAEVLPDVDLRVNAEVDGFSYVLVVKSAAAAASPELASVSVGIEAGGGLAVLQDADGVVVVRDAAGETVFSAPAAYMWDSSEPEGGEPEGDPESGVAAEGDGSGLPGDGGPGRFTDMPLELDGGDLTVEPDQELLTDPDVEFPVLVDPPFSGKRLSWANVLKAQPSRGWTGDSQWPRKGGMRVGNLQYWPGYSCGTGCGVWRSAVRFNIRKLGGKEIISAAVKAVQTHTGGCDNYGLQLWWVNKFYSGDSWNDISWRDRLQTRHPASSNRTGGCSGTGPTGVTYDNSAVRDRVQSHADSGYDSLSFGFRSSNESSKRPWRRIAIDSVKLEVVYNRAAQRSTSLDTDGKGCATSGPGPWLTTQRPTLSGKPRDPDQRVGAHLQIRKVGSSGTFYSWKSGRNRKHNTVVNHRIPSSDRLPSGNYRWRMRSLDNHRSASSSSWRQWCYFRLDVTSPTSPTVELVGDPPAAGEEVTLRFHSSDAHSGMDGFAYGIDEEVQRHSLSSSGTAEITFTAPEAGGRNWVYVWSRDNAGNLSNRAVFDFFAARFVEATPAAAWRLDGDGVDDSGQGHQLMFGSGGAWETDAGPPADSSLGFDGTGCVATDGPVVRTDAEYTVAAWVRLDGKTERQTIIGQSSRVRMGFYLRYREGRDRWQFLLGDADTRDSAWASLHSSEAPTVGQWTHLAVRVDPAARHLQMYVNGQLDGEREIPWATWNADGPLRVGCSARTSGHTWNEFGGAVHHAGVWQGLLTPEQVQAAYEGNLAAGVTGDWRLRGDGADSSDHVREVTVPAGAGFVDDQFGRRHSAMQLDGTTAAEAAGPIVKTDQSFSVAGWAKLADKSDFRTVVSQGGHLSTNFNLSYHPHHDRWQLSMASRDSVSEVTWHRAQSTAAPQVGQWYHLVGVFDRAAGELRLYVDGELQATVAGAAEPWRAEGPLVIGAGGEIPGDRFNHMVGTISDVKTWRGALTDDQAADVYGGNPAVAGLSEWSLDGHGNDLVGSHDLTLIGAEGVDYDWVTNQLCRPWSALGLRMSGDAHARTGGPVVATDGSFTVTTWVKLESLGAQPQTVLSQGGDVGAAMYLQATPEGAWRFAMPQQDAASPPWASAESAAGSVQVGEWTHLAGVFDLAAGEVRLYVDGELAAVDSDGVTSPWHADGPFYIGAAGTAGGADGQQVHGAIDTVTTWRSTLDPDPIAGLAWSPTSSGSCPW